MSDAARKAARDLNRDFGELAELQVAKKAPADFVSAADIKAEQTIFEVSQKNLKQNFELQSGDTVVVP